MKLKQIIVILLAVIIIMITVCFNTLANDGFLIRLNWGINLPNSDRTIYYIDSNPFFNGDYEAYKILEYKTKNKIAKLNNIKWIAKKDTIIEEKINSILSGLKVKEENYPSFNSNYRYYYLKEEDSSELFMINQPNDNKLYVIENTY